MVALQSTIVETEIIKIIDEVNCNILNVDHTVDCHYAPGDMGISSQVLITIMGRVGSILNVSIPEDCYIFFDKKLQRQLTIKEAAQKLINEAKTNGNEQLNV